MKEKKKIAKREKDYEKEEKVILKNNKIHRKQI